MQKCVNTHTIMATLCRVVRKWKQPKCPSADQWINKMWYIYTMKYYSTIKRNEVLIHAAIGMKSRNISLSERGQAQKGKYYMIPHI